MIENAKRKTQNAKLGVVIFLILLLIPIGAIIGPTAAQAQIVPRFPFGGKMVIKKPQVCLIRIPFPPFMVPHPFWGFFSYYEIQQFSPPFLHKVWDIGVFNTDYREYRKERRVWLLGDYDPSLVPLVRESCTAFKILEPIVFGVLRQIGTGCRPGEILDLNNNCRRPF